MSHADDFFSFASLNTNVVISDCAYSPDVIIDSVGQPALRNMEPEHGNQFELGQNYPNPYVDETSVPFTLIHPSDVHLDIFDLQGRKVAGVVRKNRNPGLQSIKLNLRGLGLPAGSYLYRLQVTNKHGVFSQRKLMKAE